MLVLNEVVLHDNSYSQSFALDVNKLGKVNCLATSFYSFRNSEQLLTTVCLFSGCRSLQGDVYKSGETWRESDCVTCRCVEDKKECQAEMCVKTCLKPIYVPGRCCPICESKS